MNKFEKRLKEMEARLNDPELTSLETDRLISESQQIGRELKTIITQKKMELYGIRLIQGGIK